MSHKPYHDYHIDILNFGSSDAENCEKKSESTNDDHNVGSMNEVICFQKATRFVRLWVSYEPYSDAEYGAAEHLSSIERIY